MPLGDIEHHRLLAAEIGQQRFELQVALLGLGRVLLLVALLPLGQPARVILLTALVVLGIEQGLAQLGDHAHARRRELLLALLIVREVHGQRDIALEDHVLTRASGELDEDVFAGKGVGQPGRNNRVGDAVVAVDRDARRLSMEGVGHVHVRHDLVRRFGKVARHGVGLDLDQAEVGFRVDQAGVDRHAARIDDLRAGRHLDRPGRAYGGNLAAREHDRPVLDRAVGDGQQLAAGDGDGRRLREGRGGRKKKDADTVTIHCLPPSPSSAPSNPDPCMTPLKCVVPQPGSELSKKRSPSI